MSLVPECALHVAGGMRGIIVSASTYKVFQ